MKVGILTFHSQLNYGGVLQCWALQTVLEKLGHEVVVVDRWLQRENSSLELGYNKFGPIQWIKFMIRASLGLGDINQWLRVMRTKRFLCKYIKRTPYHFVDWGNAPRDLGIDMLVVGSDQVWHCGDWGAPTAYLLEGASNIPAISYAASFGMKELPQGFAELYKRGLSRFNAISCREREGLDICCKLGFQAVHVVDPTLLAWSEGAEERSNEQKKHELVCYLLSEKIENHFDALNRFAHRNDCKVMVFLNNTLAAAIPTNLVRVKSLLKIWKLRLSPRIKIMDSAGPEEFYREFKNASWVVSDSFHALMFSICNGCNVRIIKPTSEKRKGMFARIEEFAENTNGPLVVDSVQDALDSFARDDKVKFNYDWVSSKCQSSEKWLKANLK